MIKCKIEHRLLNVIVMLARLFKSLNGPIKPPERLFKSKSFSVAVCSDWMLYRTWVLIKKVKKNENSKKVSGKLFFHRSRKIHSKIPSKIDHKSTFHQLELAPSSNWLLNQPGRLFEAYIRTLRLISKFMTSQTGVQVITINILPHISGRKATNQ